MRCTHGSSCTLVAILLCRDANAQALEHESTRPVLSVHFNYAAGYVDRVIEWFTARTDLCGKHFSHCHFVQPAKTQEVLWSTAHATKHGCPMAGLPGLFSTHACLAQVMEFVARRAAAAPSGYLLLQDDVLIVRSIPVLLAMLKAENSFVVPGHPRWATQNDSQAVEFPADLRADSINDTACSTYWNAAAKSSSLLLRTQCRTLASRLGQAPEGLRHRVLRACGQGEPPHFALPLAKADVFYVPRRLVGAFIEAAAAFPIGRGFGLVLCALSERNSSRDTWRTRGRPFELLMMSKNPAAESAMQTIRVLVRAPSAHRYAFLHAVKLSNGSTAQLAASVYDDDHSRSSVQLQYM